METVDLGRFVISFLIVIGMIGALALLLRKTGVADKLAGIRQGQRLAVVESVMLDAKRRLVLIRRDGAHHLLLLSQSGDLVVERDIPPMPLQSGENTHA